MMNGLLCDLIPDLIALALFFGVSTSAAWSLLVDPITTGAEECVYSIVQFISCGFRIARWYCERTEDVVGFSCKRLMPY